MATTDLTVYGAREEINELGLRLQSFMPAAQSLTKTEAMAVAQIALAHGLDPFNGEVWGIKGDNQWYGIMVGVKGLRKCAARQAREEDCTYWIDNLPCDPAKYNEPATSVVYECVLRDTKTTQAWGMAIKAITSAGATYKEAVEMIGKAPCVVGVGIATPSERSKMKIHARAKKRAESDAIKMRFQVSFGAGVFAEGDKETPEIAYESEPVDAVDGQAEEVRDEPPAQPKRSEAQSLYDLGFESPLPSVIEQPKGDAPRYRASGTKIVGLVASITGLDNGAAAKLLLARWPVSAMLTETEATEFAQNNIPGAPTIEGIPA